MDRNPDAADRPAAMPLDDEAEVGHEIVTETGRFALVYEWVLDHPDITDGEFRIYVAMRLWANAQGSLYPSTRKIAEKARAKVSTVRNAFSKFRKLGLISTTQNKRPDGSIIGLRIVMHDVPRPGTFTEQGDPPSPRGETPLHRAVKVTSPHGEGKNRPVEQTTEQTIERMSRAGSAVAGEAAPSDGEAPTTPTPWAQAGQILRRWWDYRVAAGMDVPGQAQKTVQNVLRTAIANNAHQPGFADQLTHDVLDQVQDSGYGFSGATLQRAISEYGPTVWSSAAG